MYRFLDHSPYNSIPVNELSHFKIQIDLEWKNSINILFHHEEKVNIINLFLILKSFLHETRPKVKHIYIISQQTDDASKRFILLKNAGVFYLNKISFGDFINWYNDEYDNYYEYIKESYNLGFRLVFYSDSLNYKNELKELKPQYPWKNELLKMYGLTTYIH